MGLRSLKGCPHESAERTVGIMFVQNIFAKKIDLKSWKNLTIRGVV
jgi:hypothetical protein